MEKKLPIFHIGTSTTPVIEKEQPEKEAVIEPMKKSIFFALNSAKIQDDQMIKISSLIIVTPCIVLCPYF